MAKDKDYPKEEKSGEVRKLKSHIHHLENEIKKLKSELKTYDAAFKKNVIFLKEKTSELSIEDLLKGAEKELTLRQIKDEKVQSFEDLKKRWKCFSCEDGLLKMIVVPHNGGSRYFRRCSNPGCGNRTPVKEYTENIEGLK